ncbi:hypothetical protein [Persicobacter sp. CCB-QB2]|uniref:hypothetical protein n=1 Tax=Persicobacter sp. CCB-QB2 TaxID=1561025 RepID=UPI0006A9EF92|nr:hypothetical protein [Persicobacter sp. CCB-QB2]
MLTPKVNIKIAGRYLFKGCKSFRVLKDLDNLSATGELRFPVMMTLLGQRMRIDDTIRTGDEITIEAGYLEEEIREIFQGYITNIDTGTEVRVRVEDAVYQLRKRAIVINEKNTTVKQIAAKLIEGTALKVSSNTIEAGIDKMTFKGNAAGALAKLRETFNFTVSMDHNELYIGGIGLNPKAQVPAIFGRNILKNNVAYQYADANPVQITVVGKKPDGTEVKIIKGMEGGMAMTFFRYNVTDTKVLENIADQELKRYYYDGFEGSLKMFFIPFAEAGGSVSYQNLNYQQEVEGKYFIRAVNYSFSPADGLRQDLKLGFKL